MIIKNLVSGELKDFTTKYSIGLDSTKRWYTTSTPRCTAVITYSASDLTGTLTGTINVMGSNDGTNYQYLEAIDAKTLVNNDTDGWETRSWNYPYLAVEFTKGLIESGELLITVCFKEQY